MNSGAVRATADAFLSERVRHKLALWREKPLREGTAEKGPAIGTFKGQHKFQAY